MNAYDPQAYTISCVDSIQTEMATRLHLAPVGNKAVDLDFDGGLLSSDAGLMLLKEPDEQLGLTRALAAVLKDSRDPRRVHFTLHDLLKQRVFQIAAGYEDANDANTLRHDPIFKLLLDRLPDTGPPWRHNRRSRGSKTTSHAPSSTAWPACWWINFSPPTPAHPSSSSSTSMTPRTLSMASRNRPVTM